MKFEEIKKDRILSLQDYTTKEIRGFIQKYNNTLKIKGYSNYNKNQMIELIQTHKSIKPMYYSNGITLRVLGENVNLDYKFKPKKVIVKKLIKRKKKTTPPTPPTPPKPPTPEVVCGFCKSTTWCMCRCPGCGRGEDFCRCGGF